MPKKSPIKLYFRHLIYWYKNLFFRKFNFREDGWLLLCALIILYFISIFLPIQDEFKKYFALSIIIIEITITIAWACLTSYNNFKKYNYGKIIIPEDIKELEKTVGFDTAQYLKNLDDRVNALEKFSPLKITIYIAIFTILLTIVLAVAIPFAFHYLPK